MRSTSEILSQLKALKSVLSSQFSVRSMALFGSYARGEQVESSDVDIIVECDENIGIRFIDLAERIESELGVKTEIVSMGGIKSKYFQSIKDDLIYV